MKNQDKTTKKIDIEFSPEISDNSKSKFRFLGLALLVVLLVSVSAGFANVDSGKSKALAAGKPQAVKTLDPNCATKIMLVFDRSSSIGVTSLGGHPLYVAQMRQWMYDLVNSVKGPNTYMDVYTFGTTAQRVNSGGWFHMPDQAAADFQNWVIGTTPIKVGATSNASGDQYGDPFDADSEGLTNWSGALATAAFVNGLRPATDRANTVIFFTDGDPTTNQGEVDFELGPSGNQTFPNATQTGTDLSDAQAMADVLASQGTTVIPVGVTGSVNTGNLSAISRGVGGYYSWAPSFADLTAFLGAVTNKIPCNTPLTSTLGIIATDTLGNQLPNVKFDYNASPFTGGVFDTGASGDFTYKTSTTGSNWGFNTGYNSGAPPYYVVDNVYCRQGAWSAASPIISNNGNVPGGTIAPGETVRCHYTFKDSRIPRTPLMTVTVSSPSPTEVYEETTVDLTTTVTIKNNGNVTLDIIQLNSTTASTPDCNALSIAPTTTATCTYINSVNPRLGAPSPHPFDVIVKARATINPTLEYFTTPYPSGFIPDVFSAGEASSGIISGSGSTTYTVPRLLLPV